MTYNIISLKGSFIKYIRSEGGREEGMLGGRSFGGGPAKSALAPMEGWGDSAVSTSTSKNFFTGSL